MSPKNPIRYGASTSSSETPHMDLDLPLRTHSGLPLSPELHGADLTSTTQSHPPAELPALHPLSVEIIDLPADLHVTPAITPPIEQFFIPSNQTSRLAPANPNTGIREHGTQRHFVDLQEGGTVLLGIDLNDNFRARLNSELAPSGPILEKVEGTLTWRVKPDGEPEAAGESRLSSKRPGEPIDEDAAASATKRPATSTDVDQTTPWNKWALPPSHIAINTIEINGSRYATVPYGSDPHHRIAYIKNPEHTSYDFDFMENTLIHDPQQQPRGAIREKSDGEWLVDHRLTFERPLERYVATFFPQLSKTSLRAVAKHQFMLANDGETATGIGLTRLRQTFSDWNRGSSSPDPKLVDPLLMLPTIATSSSGTEAIRTQTLPNRTAQGPLQRLDFDLTGQEWAHLKATPIGTHLKQFMKNLLERQGYEVFRPTDSNIHPALVFRRKNHSFVFFLNLSRVEGTTIQPALNFHPASVEYQMLNQIGFIALAEVYQARAAGRLVWLRGGSQTLASEPDTLFIVRDDEPSIVSSIDATPNVFD